MDTEVLERIKVIRRGKVPEGYKRTKAGIAPMEWKESRFRSMFERLNQKNDECNTNVLTISAQFGLVNQEEFFKKSIASEDKTNYYLLNKGDFAYNKSYSSGYSYGAVKRLEKYDKGIVSPLYICFKPSANNKCPDYYVQYFEGGKIDSEIRAIAQEGARNHGLLNVAVDDFFDMKILEPPLGEQKRIADILSTQDQLIESCKKKLARLKELKKAMLQKMFPAKGERVPEVRFPGFTGAWERKKFANVFVGLQNNTFSRSELNYENGTVKNIHYGDVLIKFGYYIDVSVTELPYIFDDTKAEKFTNAFLQDGDIVIADTAEDDTVGKCTEIRGCEDIKVLSGLHTIPCRPKEKYGSKFLGYYMNSPAYHNQLKPLMQGIKVNSISKTALQDTNILVPVSMDEQTAIGEYLANIDNLITLHQRKCDLEKRKKKALTQLLLTGIVRT